MSSAYTKVVLESIEKNNLLPPLQVIKILSKSEKATLGLVKDYVVNNLLKEQKVIDDDQRLIRSYLEETEKNKEEITNLKSGAKLFQSMKCNICQAGLDLPAVHFLCMHSFHLRCLGENEGECPLCATEMKNFENYQKALKEKSQKHDEFFKQMENCPDGFSLVAQYFGRGVFSNVNQVIIGRNPKVKPLTESREFDSFNELSQLGKKMFDV